MRKKLDLSFLILLALIFIAAAAVYWAGGYQRIGLGLGRSVHLIKIVWLRLLLGFILGGMLQVLIPHEIIAKWLGPTSGLKGILIGSYAGIFLSGGPFIRLPIIASIYRAGAGIGPVISLLTGNVVAIQTPIVWEIPFLGVGITLSRYLVSLFIPPLAGLAGAVIYRLLPFPSRKGIGNIQDDFYITNQQDTAEKNYPGSNKDKSEERWISP